MAYEETELKQAEQLDRVVQNIIQDDCDLFEGTESRQLPHDTLAIVDLATFVMPLKAAEGKEFVERLQVLVAREVQHREPACDPASRKAARAWSRFTNAVLGVGLATAAFCAALLLEPMPAGRGGRSIDTLSRPWYNVTMGKYLVGSVEEDAGPLSYFGFSDAGSAYRATACR